MVEFFELPNDTICAYIGDGEIAVLKASNRRNLTRWVSDGDIATVDPYGRNETFLPSFLANIYEPLARRDESLHLEPALAVSFTAEDTEDRRDPRR